MKSTFRYAGVAILFTIIGFVVSRITMSTSHDNQTGCIPCAIDLHGFENYGDPIQIPTGADYVWSAFARDFDWIVMGRGRIRFSSENAKPAWRQVMRIPLQSALEEAKSLEYWQKIVQLSHEKGDTYVKSIIKAAQNTRQPWMDTELSELSVLPFILLEIKGENISELLKKYPGTTIESARLKTKLINYCKSTG